MNHTTNPQDACPNCSHPQHAPGTECEGGVDHGRNHWHQCLCLNQPNASRPCPPQMNCQGGPLGYSDIWHLQQGHSLSSTNGVITPEVLHETPVVSPSVVVSADRAALRDRIADTVMPFLLNFSDEESARINAAEVATALLADVPASEAVCICGHSKQQHFEDACITEITGCNCGDYLEPQDAAEVIDRWRQAALQARATDRATLLREAATRLWHQTSGLTEYGRGARWAVAELRAMADCPACGVGVEHDVHGADGPSRAAAEEQPTETQDGIDLADRLEAALTERFTELGNPFSEMRRHEQGPDGWPASHPVGPNKVAEVLRELMADETPAERAAVAEQPDTQTREARPPAHRWWIETLDNAADEWAPGTRYTDRTEALERYGIVSAHYPLWKDGTPVQRRFVRETTSYTVEDSAP